MSARPRGRPRKRRDEDKPAELIISDVTAGKELVTRPVVEIRETPPITLGPPQKRGRGRPSTKSKDGGGAVASGSGTSSVAASDGVEYDFIENKPEGGGGVPLTTMKKIAKSLPDRDNDNDMVTCGDCGKQFTYRQFRLHNIQCHVNTAPTTVEKEDLVMDHKYFARKLNEFKKLTKMTVFACPRQGCKSSFMSTLGLAYHMNTCGRSKEELDAVLLQCEVCHAKFTLPNMQWHRKIHEEKTDAMAQPDPTARKDLSSKAGKRKSALLARRSFKRLSGPSGGESTDKAGEEEWNDEDEDDEDENEIYSEMIGGSRDQSSSSKSRSSSSSISKKRGELGKPILDLDSNDYTALALEFLESLDQKGYKAWEDPPRVGEDPFLRLRQTDNPLQSPKFPEEYLPSHKESVEFKYTSEDNLSSNYHRLNWFEGETVPCSSSSATSSASIHHAGGPVLSMSWHPSGKLLAVSVAQNYEEEIDSLVCQHRKSCVQIYRRSSTNVLSLLLVCGIKWGYATHIQWSTFCPDIMESYDPSVESCFDDIEIYCRIGYLAISCEDSTVRIMSLGIQDLKVKPNYDYKPQYKIKVYQKTPEITLKVDESVIDDDPIGNAVRFDWHEGNKYIAVGYASGVVAVYDLQTKSPLLLQQTVVSGDDPADAEATATVINPIWTFHGHRLGVRGVLFDPVDPRYLVTCGQDRLMKVWDLHTKTERDNKRVGICLDICWVRGWMHQVASFENIVAYQSAMHNYVRIFQTGSSVGKPSSAEIFNVTSMDFYHGLTAQGTDDGKVNATYYDWFWRECDYERNRKKKNLVVLSSVEVDKESYQKFAADDFTVSVKKLSQSVFNSKLYQRLGINDEEGVYSISLEAKFRNVSIFDPLPDLEHDVEENKEVEEEDGGGIINGVKNITDDNKVFTQANETMRSDVDEEEEKSDNDTGDSTLSTYLSDAEDADSVVSDAINSAVQKAKDGLIPIYDVKTPECVPRLNISFLRRRPSTAIPVEGLEPHQVEEYIRFHSFIRVNKVSWSPNGDVIAVGYRNGLITLLPGTFESIFMS